MGSGEGAESASGVAYPWTPLGLAAVAGVAVFLFGPGEEAERAAYAGAGAGLVLGYHLGVWAIERRDPGPARNVLLWLLDIMLSGGVYALFRVCLEGDDPDLAPALLQGAAFGVIMATFRVWQARRGED